MPRIGSTTWQGGAAVEAQKTAAIASSTDRTPTTESWGDEAGLDAQRDDRPTKAHGRGLRQASLRPRYPANLAREAYLGEGYGVLRDGAVTQARRDGERHRKVDGGLLDADAAGDVQEHVRARE